jgi:hypothetical protein
VENIVDRVGKRCAEHRNGGGEHQARPIAIPHMADRLQQQPRAIQVDAIPFVEIGLGLTGNDGGQVENHLRPAGDQLPGQPWHGKIPSD